MCLNLRLLRKFAQALGANHPTYDGSHDLRAVQKLLGHSSLATTQRYVATRPETLREALRHAS